mgnify:CR=1 FL=1
MRTEALVNPGAPAAAYTYHTLMHTAAGVLVGTTKPLQRCVSRQEGGPLAASFIGPVVQLRYMSTSHSQTLASNSRNVSKAVTQVQKHTPLLQDPPLSPPQVHPAPPRR